MAGDRGHGRNRAGRTTAPGAPGRRRSGAPFRLDWHLLTRVTGLMALLGVVIAIAVAVSDDRSTVQDLSALDDRSTASPTPISTPGSTGPSVDRTEVLGQAVDRPTPVPATTRPLVLVLPTPTDVPAPTPPDAPTPTSTPPPAPTATPTPAPTVDIISPPPPPTRTPVPRPTRTPRPTAAPTRTPAPTATPLPRPTATPTTRPSSTPVPTETPEPTPVPPTPTERPRPPRDDD